MYEMEYETEGAVGQCRREEERKIYSRKRRKKKKIQVLYSMSGCMCVFIRQFYSRKWKKNSCTCS